MITLGNATGRERHLLSEALLLAIEVMKTLPDEYRPIGDISDLEEMLFSDLFSKDQREITDLVVIKLLPHIGKR